MQGNAMSSKSSKASSASGDAADKVVVGRVRRPHGVRGAVVVEVYSDIPDRFAVGREVEVVDTQGRTRVLGICDSSKGAEVLRIRFQGIEDRDSAEGLRDAWLQIPQSEVPAAPAGAFYFFQLMGCEVVDRRAGDLGCVLDVVEDGGGLLLSVKRGQNALLVPFVDRYIEVIDLEARRIALNLPEGLVDVCGSR